MKRAVIVAGVCGAAVIGASLLGLLGFMYRDDPRVTPYINFQAPAKAATAPAPTNIDADNTPSTKLAVEKTARPAVAMFSGMRVAGWVVGGLVVAGMMAGLVVLVLRRHDAVLADALANSQPPPSASAFLLNTLNPKSSAVVAVPTDLPPVLLQDTTSTVEQYVLLVLCVGLTFGLISFVSNLLSTFHFERAAIAGFKSTIFSAIGQAIILSVILFL